MKAFDDQPPTDFGRALRAARQAKNLSQEHFIEVTSQTHMSRLERGKKLPNVGMVEKLANAMELHPLALFVLSYLPSPSIAEVRRLMGSVERQIEDLDLGKLRGDDFDAGDEHRNRGLKKKTIAGSTT